MFFSFLDYRQHALSKNSQRTRIFSKTLSRVKIFENVRFSFTCTWGCTKTEIFEYDDVIHHLRLESRMPCEGCYFVLSSYFHCLAFLYGRAITIRIRYVWTRIFFKTEAENMHIRFQNIWIRLPGWTGPKCFTPTFRCKNVHIMIKIGGDFHSTTTSSLNFRQPPQWRNEQQFFKISKRRKTSWGIPKQFRKFFPESFLSI